MKKSGFVVDADDDAALYTRVSKQGKVIQGVLKLHIRTRQGLAVKWASIKKRGTKVFLPVMVLVDKEFVTSKPQLRLLRQARI